MREMTYTTQDLESFAYDAICLAASAMKTTGNAMTPTTQKAHPEFEFSCDSEGSVEIGVSVWCDNTPPSDLETDVNEHLSELSDTGRPQKIAMFSVYLGDDDIDDMLEALTQCKRMRERIHEAYKDTSK